MQIIKLIILIYILITYTKDILLPVIKDIKNTGGKNISPAEILITILAVLAIVALKKM